ncbi:MAG TPA: mannosyltransferase, partial [Lacibacter sp.]|nr:mannosyltransferase [Lacibacter sp.]
MADSIHLVAFDVPFPADYGGVVDVFWRIRALHEQGVRIKLHCFEYGRGEQKALLNYCSEVHYYQRSEGHKGLSLNLPYIVASRNHPALWQRLQEDDDPVLLEGMHSTYGLHAGMLPNRRVAVRMHNVEQEYYRQLAQWERSLVKKAYYHHESRMLGRYEKTIAAQNLLLPISDIDAGTCRRVWKAPQVQVLPAFVPHRLVTSQPGSGTFALYHGNLSVAENEKAATWLLEKIFNDLEIPFVVAGKDPAPRLVELAHRRQHTCIVENPSESEMNDLIAKAQVHIPPAFTTNGIKL